MARASTATSPRSGQTHVQAARHRERGECRLRLCSRTAQLLERDVRQFVVDERRSVQLVALQSAPDVVALGLAEDHGGQRRCVNDDRHRGGLEPSILHRNRTACAVQRLDAFHQLVDGQLRLGGFIEDCQQLALQRAVMCCRTRA